MTLKHFVTSAGVGIAVTVERTFVSPDCPYFKVRVTFRAVGQPSRSENFRKATWRTPGMLS